MTIVVGYLPAKGGRASLDLAAVLARSGLAEPVAVVTVVPQHWTTPSMAKVDAEFAAWAHQQGEDALDQARQYLAAKWPDVAATFHQTHGRSVPSALTAACEELSGDLLVLGSSTDGRVGQIIVGSTATPLLHSSEVPIAIAPRGYRAAKGSALGRLTCSFAATEEAADLLTATAQLGAATGLPAADRHLRCPRPDHVPAGGRAACRGRGPAAMARAGAGRAAGGRRPRLSDLDLLPGSTTTADRHRQQLGRGDGRGRLGGGGGPGRRVVAGRAPGPGVPRVGGHQDRPVLAGAGGRRPGRRGRRGGRGSGGRGSGGRIGGGRSGPDRTAGPDAR